MRSLKKLSLSLFSLLPVLAVATFSSSVVADQFEDSGFYFGGSYGLVTVDGEEFEDDNDYGQLFAGIQILPFLGIEAAHYDFGEYGNAFASADLTAYSVAVTGRLPVSETLAIFARLGPMWTEADITAGPFRGEADSEEVFFGAGASFEIAENLDLRLTYDWVDNDLNADDIEEIGTGDFDSDLNMFAIGLKVEF